MVVLCDRYSVRRSTSASVPRSTSTRCLVEQANQPDLFGRHEACKATLAPAKTQVICALDLQKEIFMEVQKIFGFIAPVGKEQDNIPDTMLPGSEVEKSNRLFEMLSDLFSKSKKECDVQIRFIAQTQNQDNDVRDQIVKIGGDFTIANCRGLVKSLSYLTDKKIKEGLVFFVLGSENHVAKILIARFPSEVGITTKLGSGGFSFEVIEDVFLKNSRKYKAVYYLSTDDYWIGYAVDKQINEGFGKIKEISDYWIKDFLKSELKLNSKRGSSLLAKAVRRTISETEKENVKRELVSATPAIKNINPRALTMESFFTQLNLSEETRNEVLSKIDNTNLYHITFQFDSEEFENNCNYLINILDSGAVIMAPAADFDNLWQSEMVAEDGRTKYTTEGKKVRTKVVNRI